MDVKRLLVAVAIVSALVFPMSGQTAVTLTVTPLTWNVVGLDSNKPTTGPKFFPVAARVCSSVATTNVTVTLVWDSANANVNLRPGSLNPITIASIGAGGCADAYFEIEVTQLAAAYDTTRRYHITATDGSGTASTPTPRELYVEHLVSQNRNGIVDVKLNGVSIPSGGAMNLVVGNTYTIELDGFTATQGYNQLESFINFPNTIFQILGVSTTYSADSNTGHVPNPNDRLYANACVWENDVSSPNYRSCIGGDDKAGGTVVVTYTVRIVSGGGTSQTLNTLFYDFSGSSYHYNSDFSASARIANIIDPGALTIAKAFAPGSTTAGGVSTLTVTIANPTGAPISGLSFTDTLPTSPGAMVVASPPSAATSGCGTPTFAPVAGAGSVSFSNGTVGGNGACTVSVSVTVPSTGTYNNTSNNLFVNSLDTGHSASASLTATSASAGSGLCGLTLAQWTFPSGSSATTPAPSTQAADVATAAASVANLTTEINTTSTWGNPQPEWGGRTFPMAAAADLTKYFRFSVDTTNYTNVMMTFDSARRANGPDRLDLYFGTGATPSAGTQKGATPFTTLASADTIVPISADFTGQTSGVTNFFILAYNAVNLGADAFIYVDNVTFTGCGTAQKPTLAKAFSPNPIAVNAVSTLTFTLTNPNSAQLTGVKFSDALPAGVQVAATPAASTTCGNSPSWAPGAGATTLDFGQTTGATIPASSACTASVNVTATTSGPHTNVSGFISSTESGTNSGAGGSATASLTALQPPSISKLFAPDSILTGGISTLTFLITNPNPNNSLSGVAFSDTLPTTPGAMIVAGTPNASTTGCGAPTFAPVAGAGSIAFSGATVAAGGTCLVEVDVTAPTQGDYTNTSSVVSAIVNAVTVNGNTATAPMSARQPNPAIRVLKQVSGSASGPWSPFVTVVPGANVFYRFTIENVGDVPLSPVSVTDSVLNTAACSWPATLPVASPSQDPTATCVLGPFAAEEGDHPDTAVAHGTFGGNVTDSPEVTAAYIGALPGFTLLKQVGTSPSGPWASSVSGLAPGSTVYYKFTLVNTGAFPLSAVTITDPQITTTGCTLSDPLTTPGGATTCVVGPVTGSSIVGGHPNVATAEGSNSGTPVDTPPSSATYTIATSGPDLAIAKAHTGNFTQGQVGATYTLTVSNAGLSPTAGLVTVTEAAPAGLTVTAMAGSGWTCTTLPTCTRSDVLLPTASYPTITVTVNVSPTAPASLINVASVSATGDTNAANDSASDPTTVNPGPDLTIVKSHSGSFVQGQTGATYTVTVTNLGPGSTVGTVTVTEAPPAALTVTAMAGPGWTCTTLPTCTRSDALAAPGGYPAITVTVNVSGTAAASITNVATVSGGSDTNGANNSSSDPTTVAPPAAGPDLTIQKTHAGNFVQGQTGTYTLTVKNVGGTATSGLVTVVESPPAGLTVTAMSGTGWTCTTLPTCTRSNALAPTLSYEPITVTVSVSASAAPSVINVASVSGGGDTNGANNSASDPTTVNPQLAGPDLMIQKAHGGNLVKGQTGIYTLTVKNVGGTATSGLVTVQESAPAGLTVTAMSGTGWTCTTLPTCTRSDALGPNQSYEPITVTVNVSASAPASVTNVAAVSGGGDTSPANNSASDVTAVDPPAPIPTLSVGAFVLLAGLLAAGAIGAIRRRSRPSAAR